MIMIFQKSEGDFQELSIAFFGQSVSYSRRKTHVLQLTVGLESNFPLIEKD